MKGNLVTKSVCCGAQELADFLIVEPLGKEWQIASNPLSSPQVLGRY
jgi:hypothetical protein